MLVAAEEEYMLTDRPEQLEVQVDPEAAALQEQTVIYQVPQVQQIWVQVVVVVEAMNPQYYNLVLQADPVL